MSISPQPQKNVVQSGRRLNRHIVRDRSSLVSSERPAGVANMPGPGEKPEHLVAAWSILQLYGTSALPAGNAADTLSVQTLPERLAAILLGMSTNQGDELISGVSIAALAQQLGTYKETVGAILRAFKRQGLVEFGYRCIRIADEESLRDLSGITNGMYC